MPSKHEKKEHKKESKSKHKIKEVVVKERPVVRKHPKKFKLGVATPFGSLSGGLSWGGEDRYGVTRSSSRPGLLGSSGMPGMSTLPAAFSVVGKPYFSIGHGSKPDSLRIRGREHLTSFSPPVDLDPGTVQGIVLLNPSFMGERLSQFSTLYEKFCFNQFNLYYLPRAAIADPANAGELMMSVDRDAEQTYQINDPVDVDAMFSWDSSVTFPTYAAGTLEYRNIDPRAEYYIHEGGAESGPTATAVERNLMRQCSQGTCLLVANTGVLADAAGLGLGSIYIEYDIDLFVPHTQPAAACPDPPPPPPATAQHPFAYATSTVPVGSFTADLPFNTSDAGSVSVGGAEVLFASAITQGGGHTMDSKGKLIPQVKWPPQGTWGTPPEEMDNNSDIFETVPEGLDWDPNAGKTRAGPPVVQVVLPTSSSMAVTYAIEYTLPHISISGGGTPWTGANWNLALTYLSVGGPSVTYPAANGDTVVGSAGGQVTSGTIVLSCLQLRRLVTINTDVADSLVHFQLTLQTASGYSAATLPSPIPGFTSYSPRITVACLSNWPVTVPRLPANANKTWRFNSRPRTCPRRLAPVNSTAPARPLLRAPRSAPAGRGRGRGGR